MGRAIHEVAGSFKKGNRSVKKLNNLVDTSMVALLFLGPMGSGKSSCYIKNTLTGTLQGPVGYIGNEASVPNASDVRVTSSSADIRMFSGGCFGCRNPDEIRAALRDMKSRGVRTVVVEALGMSVGGDTKELLIAEGLRVVTLTFIGPTFGDDRVMATFGHQVELADYVCVTQMRDGDALLDELCAYVALRKRPVIHLGTDAVLPQAVLGRLYDVPLRVWRGPHSCTLHAHDACGHHHHHHHHEHTHDHHAHERDDAPDERRWFSLRDEVDIEALKRLIDPFRERGLITRAKLADGTCQQNCVNNLPWKKGEEDPGRPYLIIYGATDLDWAVFTSYVADDQQAPSTEHVIANAPLTREQREALVWRLLAACPHEPVFGPSGELVTNPEALEEAALYAETLPDDSLARKAQVHHRVTWYLLNLKLLLSCEGDALRTHPFYPEWIFTLLDGPLYYAALKPHLLGDELVQLLRAREDELTHLFGKAILAWERFPSDLSKAVGRSDLKFFFEGYRADERLPFLKQVVQHGLQLARHDGRAELVALWQGYAHALS